MAITSAVSCESTITQAFSVSSFEVVPNVTRRLGDGHNALAGHQACHTRRVSFRNIPPVTHLVLCEEITKSDLTESSASDASRTYSCEHKVQLRERIGVS